MEAIQIENKINQLERNKVDLNTLRENHKEFIINKELILKSQVRFRSEKHNIFTKEVSKTEVIANDDK